MIAVFGGAATNTTGYGTIIENEYRSETVIINRPVCPQTECPPGFVFTPAQNGEPPKCERIDIPGILERAPQEEQSQQPPSDDTGDQDDDDGNGGDPGGDGGEGGEGNV